MEMAEPIDATGKGNLATVKLELYRELFEWVGPALDSVNSAKDDTNQEIPEKVKRAQERLRRQNEEDVEIRADEAFQELYGMAPPRSWAEWQSLVAAAGASAFSREAGLNDIIDAIAIYLAEETKNPWLDWLVDLECAVQWFTSVFDFSESSPVAALKEMWYIIDVSDELVQRHPRHPLSKEVKDMLTAIRMMVRDKQEEVRTKSMTASEEEEEETASLLASNGFSRIRDEFGAKVVWLRAKLQVAYQDGLSAGFRTLREGKFQLYRAAFDWFASELNAHCPAKDDHDREAMRAAELRADKEFRGMFGLAPPRSWQQWTELAVAAGCVDSAFTKSGLARVVRHFKAVKPQRRGRLSDRLTVAITANDTQVTLDGKAYAVNCDGAMLIQAIIEKDDNGVGPVSASAVVKKPERVIAALPPQLRALIRTQRGSGTWIELPDQETSKVST